VAGNQSGAETDARYATVGGGRMNAAVSSATTVGGGYNNLASNYYATVPGGRLN